MRRFMIVLAVIALGMLALAPSVMAKGTAANNFVALLSGANEVPSPPVATSAHASAQFNVSKDGSTVSFKVVVNQPSSTVVAVHIHTAPAGPSSSVAADPGSSPTKSNTPPSNTSTGSTTADYTNPSETSHPQKRRPTTTVKPSRPKKQDSHNRVSTQPGAVQSCTRRWRWENRLIVRSVGSFAEGIAILMQRARAHQVRRRQ